MIGSVRHSPLCSPRNTSLNLRSGLPKSPAADMLPVPLGLMWVLMCCYNYQNALNKKIKRYFGSVWDSQPPIQAQFCAATYHDTQRGVIDSWAQPIELERIQWLRLLITALWWHSSTVDTKLGQVFKLYININVI